MSYRNIRLEAGEGVATLTFDRPEVLNALNDETVAELGDAVGRLRADPAVKALVLTGAGERAFVAGADIQTLAACDPDGALALSRRGGGVLRALETLGKPTVAAVNGFALGGGLEIALACTVRYAAEGARLGQPEINLGIIPGYGGTQRLARLVGLGRALEILLTGEPVSAEEAHRIGLVNKVLPAEALLPEARALAAKLAAKSAPALAAILRAAHGGLDGPLDAGLALEAEEFARVFATADAREGLAAFLEKRSPRFEDR